MYSSDNRVNLYQSFIYMYSKYLIMCMYLVIEYYIWREAYKVSDRQTKIIELIEIKLI